MLVQKENVQLEIKNEEFEKYKSKGFKEVKPKKEEKTNALDDLNNKANK